MDAMFWHSDYLGLCGQCMNFGIVTKYDVRLVYCLFLQIHLQLNLVRATMEVTLVEHDDMFFGKTPMIMQLCMP